MTTTTDEGRREIEALLPWHAVGTLCPREAHRVDAALASDAELARQFVLVREELAGSIHLNETLGAPGACAMERFLAEIEPEGRTARRRSSFNLAWIAKKLSQFRPRMLVWLSRKRNSRR